MVEPQQEYYSGIGEPLLLYVRLLEIRLKTLRFGLEDIANYAKLKQARKLFGQTFKSRKTKSVYQVPRNTPVSYCSFTTDYSHMIHFWIHLRTQEKRRM